MQQAFHRARLAAPSMMIIDDIDAVFGARRQETDSKMAATLLSVLLTELDGLYSAKGSCVPRAPACQRYICVLGLFCKHTGVVLEITSCAVTDLSVIHRQLQRHKNVVLKGTPVYIVFSRIVSTIQHHCTCYVPCTASG